MKRIGLAAMVAALTIGLAVAPASARKKDDSDDKADVPIALPAPPSGKGQIVFFRSGGLGGAAVACSVHENGPKVSSLGGGRYFIMVADPGRHEFTVKTEAKDVLALEVEPDETQFASCTIKMGILVGRPDIRPATEEEFRKHKHLKLVDDDDMGPAPGALRSDEVAAALAAQAATTATAETDESAPAAASDDTAPAAASDETTPAADGAPVAEASETEDQPAPATDGQTGAVADGGERPEAAVPAEEAASTAVTAPDVAVPAQEAAPEEATAGLEPQAAVGVPPVDPSPVAAPEQEPDASEQPAPAVAPDEEAPADSPAQ
ncbi:MAG: hypothetical protein GC201_00255 [Alphaproteobacteria bacterium]|nr:hypothetical protein [Alphaproteobacteria bacterium]